ncbi:sulfite exporter TauE/SafE family protein [Thalassotalea euphylliae]|uniref:Sulfite exporter TauE/SafE family protein n=1 Tax=Thalassotalea euphylliae TaxID=1655234 RepID=A0A3E0TYF7_9GAMM|nr:sulfite exporter TauE/SafE family protein [Thalassotalea euphylliae]REL29686.1 sulfite exporter TauE/SafE family protein [Thalassotalea euphylliae]
MNIDLFSAFIIGLLGAGHCIAMCGGVSGMLLSAIPAGQNQQKFSLIVGYNLGRILSYSLIGGIVGFTGSITAKNLGVPLTGLRLLSGVFLILLGLYLGQWFMLLAKVEQAGKKLWQFISPLAKHFLPVNNKRKAFGLGAVWGWLPCGLVYSTLTWALASGSFSQGALIMAAFGAGTLPALLTLSFGVFSVKKMLQNRTFRNVLATGLICYGLYTLFIAYRLMF